MATPRYRRWDTWTPAGGFSLGPGKKIHTRQRGNRLQCFFQDVVSAHFSHTVEVNAGANVGELGDMSKRRQKRRDFLSWLGPDLSLQIFTKLDDPTDLVRAGAVSRPWRDFVIANGFCKNLCLRMFPEISRVVCVMELNNLAEPLECGSNSSLEWGNLKRDHRVYAHLARSFTSFKRRYCILDAICATSTDSNEVSIENTLDPSDYIEQRDSHWSSKGASNPAVPETLTYRLVSMLCVLSEISIQPFQAYDQVGCPIYSARAVRFRMGHFKRPMDESSAGPKYANDFFVSTYVSPEFPMAQENRLQKFKLPEPVLCIGGILQVDLLGRVQRQEMDGLFYVCVSRVRVVGRPLSPTFDIEILDRSTKSGKCILKYYPNVESYMARSRCSRSKDESGAPSVCGWVWEQMIIITLLGYLDGDYESDEDEVP